MLNSAVASFPDSFCIVKVIFLLKGSVPHQAVSTRCGNKTPKSLFPLAEPPPNLFHYTWKSVKPLVQHLFVSSLIVIQFPPLVFAQCLCFFTFLVLLTFWLRSLFVCFLSNICYHPSLWSCLFTLDFESIVLWEPFNEATTWRHVQCRSSYRLQFILLCLCILVKPNLMQVKFIMQHFAL